jgi:porin
MNSRSIFAVSLSLLLNPVFAKQQSKVLSSPRSVEGTLELDEKDGDSLSYLRIKSIDKAFGPYQNWKSEFSKKTNIRYGVDYQNLIQDTNSDLTNRSAMSGILRLYSTATLLNAGKANSGSLTAKVEHRNNYGDKAVPLNYGFEAGYYGISGNMFGKYSKNHLGLTNLFWKQYLNEGKFSFMAGKLDPTDYLGVYGLMNPLTSFMNLSFSSDQSMFLPNQGLGIAFGTMLNDNFYLIGGVNDANGDAREMGFDTTFDEGEFFSSIELGWTTSQDRLYFDNFHFTLWHVDAHTKFNASPEGWGANFSTAMFIDDTYMPFVRGGFSKDGAALMKETLSVGLGKYMGDTKDLFGVGVNWSNPSDSLRAQWASEVFYRVQIANNIAITPDLQFVKNPALNTSESSTWIYGVRGRINF